MSDMLDCLRIRDIYLGYDVETIIFFKSFFYKTQRTGSNKRVLSKNNFLYEKYTFRQQQPMSTHKTASIVFLLLTLFISLVLSGLTAMPQQQRANTAVIKTPVSEESEERESESDSGSEYPSPEYQPVRPQVAPMPNVPLSLPIDAVPTLQQQEQQPATVQRRPTASAFSAWSDMAQPTNSTFVASAYDAKTPLVSDAATREFEYLTAQIH
jgi:hypothetical protein